MLETKLSSQQQDELVTAPAHENLFVLVCLLAVAGLGLWIQLRIYPNHDVAWVLWGSQQMLHGAKFGRDIIAANPPLAWYLSMPTTALAEWLNVPLDRPFTIAVALAGTLSAGSLIWLRPARIKKPYALLLAAVATAGLVVLPGREFGQREPLMMIAVLPYLALSARRFDGATVPGSATTAMIGMIAGVGLAFKPYFLAVPLLVELSVQLLGKSPQKLFRSENVAIAAIIGIYAVWILLFEQPYLLEVVPLEREIYWAFDFPYTVIAIPLLWQLVGPAGLSILSFQRKDGLGIVLFAALCGFAFSYLVQHKGYWYHLMPVQTMALLIAARFTLDADLSRPIRVTALVLAAALSLIWLDRFQVWWNWARPGGAIFTQVEQINASLTQHARGQGYLVVAVRTYPSFPSGIYAPSHYVSRTSAQMFLPALVQLRAEGHPSALLEKHARKFILRDIRQKPKLVLIDTDSQGHTGGPKNFDFLAFYKEDPAFRAEWALYREIEPIGQYRQFIRVANATGDQGIALR